MKLEGTRASVNPIAGTTKPGDGDEERLLASEKDRAEHVMLVDLGRNDLSRCAGLAPSGRALPRRRALARQPPRLGGGGGAQAGVSPFDLLRATFPAGTVSGAPKIRAMQIISELEATAAVLRGSGRVRPSRPAARSTRASASE